MQINKGKNMLNWGFLAIIKFINPTLALTMVESFSISNNFERFTNFRIACLSSQPILQYATVWPHCCALATQIHFLLPQVLFKTKVRKNSPKILHIYFSIAHFHQRFCSFAFHWCIKLTKTQCLLFFFFFLRNWY